MELKAPFPYFGGKSKIAAEIWPLFGEVRNYVEPFAGSLAVLLARPNGFSGAETVNDWSCQLVNAWRPIANAPDELAETIVAPPSEVQTESQHWQLINTATELRNALGDPAFFDINLAAYYIKGANEWIGSGWASGEGPWSWSRDGGWVKRGERGVRRKLPHLGDAGTGINRQLPHLGDAGKGINRQLLGDSGTGQYEQRIDFVSGWLSALRDRICEVRIACGDFERVLSPSVTTKLGVTAVFLDPPYDGTEYVYGAAIPVSQRVRDWCSTNGSNPEFRIVLAGRGDEHDALVQLGWTKQIWTANQGYAHANTEARKTETIWISPHCVK